MGGAKAGGAVDEAREEYKTISIPAGDNREELINKAIEVLEDAFDKTEASLKDKIKSITTPMQKLIDRVNEASKTLEKGLTKIIKS